MQIAQIKKNPQMETYMANEVKSLKELKHNPNIVQLKATMQDSQNFYFVYEYCNGGDLEGYLEK